MRLDWLNYGLLKFNASVKVVQAFMLFVSFCSFFYNNNAISYATRSVNYIKIKQNTHYINYG